MNIEGQQPRENYPATTKWHVKVRIMESVESGYIVTNQLYYEQVQ